MADIREVDDTKQFSFFESFWRQLEMLDMETRGEYVSAMCRMAFDEQDTTFDDPMLQFGWSVMRTQVRQSVKVHKKAVERGKRSAEKRKRNRERKNIDKNGETLSESVSENVSETCSQRKERNGTEMTFPVPGAPTESRPNGHDEPQYINAATGEPYVPPEYDIDLSDIPLPTEDVGE